MTRKSMWKRVKKVYTTRWGEHKIRVTPKRHGKRYKAHKRARQEIRPGSARVPFGEKDSGRWSVYFNLKQCRPYLHYWPLVGYLVKDIKKNEE